MRFGDGEENVLLDASYTVSDAKESDLERSRRRRKRGEGAESDRS